MTENPDEFNWLRYDEELSLGAKLLLSAKTPFEERGALIRWLKAVEATVADHYDSTRAEPAVLLWSALEHLNGGTTPELLRPEAVPPTFPAWQSARARAVAVVDELVRVGAKLDVAIQFVSKATGMQPSALRSLRKTVHAGKSQKGVRGAMQTERQKLANEINNGGMPLSSLGLSPIKLIASILRDDRLIHSRLRKGSHPGR